MKLTHFSKSARTIGLMTLLSVMVSVTATACTNTVENKTDNTKVSTAPMNAKPTQSGTIVDIAVENPSFSTLVKAVKAAGLAETLSGKGPYTLFAPTNEAFAALPKGTLEALLKPENRDVLRKVLTYHVVSGDVMSKDLRSGKVPTVAGSTVAVEVKNQNVNVNDASVVKADIDANNGVIHVIDRVLLPPDLSLAKPTAATPMNSKSAQSGTIVDVALGNPDFSTLVTAVKAAGLADTLSGKGPFTLFAPTNEAFAALPKGTLEKLLKPENRDLLKKVLTYHVVSGDLMAKDLHPGNVATVEGNGVAVKIQGQNVSVNDAKVVKADIDSKNGVIHVIDKVLLPPGL